MATYYVLKIIKSVPSLWQVEPNERPPADGLEAWLLDHKRPGTDGERAVAFREHAGKYTKETNTQRRRRWWFCGRTRGQTASSADLTITSVLQALLPLARLTRTTTTTTTTTTAAAILLLVQQYFYYIDTDTNNTHLLAMSS